MLKKVAKKLITQLEPRLEQQGVIIDNFNYKNLLLNSYNSCAMVDIVLDFHLNRKMYDKATFKAQFKARSITFRFADFKDPSFFFTFKDFELRVEPDDDAEKKPFGKLDNGYLKTRIPLHIQYPEESAKEIFAELKTLFRTNKSVMDLEIKADVHLSIDDKEVKVGFFTERINQQTFLKFNANEILKAALQFELYVSEQEAKIMANHPSKVPALIKITRDARRFSSNEKTKDENFPEDAYKHIYWSYHLSRAFGADLAKEITDAHETIPNNTKNERLMDFHNNEQGRKLAKEILTVDEIKDLVLNSSDVIRGPDEVR